VLSLAEKIDFRHFGRNFIQPAISAKGQTDPAKE
jgi:hypothetical protein